MKKNLMERALIHYYYLPATPYPHAGHYPIEKKELKENAAIQQWYYNSPAYPYNSAGKYPKETEIDKEAQRNAEGVMDRLKEKVEQGIRDIGKGKSLESVLDDLL